MSLELACEHCGRQLRVNENTAGKRIRCPQCHFILEVPSNGKPAPAASRLYLKTPSGESYGPVPRHELDAWVEEGRVTADSQILRDGESRWQWASEWYPHLTPAPRPAPSLPPTPAGTPGPALPHRSGRSRVVAGLLGLILPFFGFCGVQRLYLGHIGIGLLQFITFGLCGIWQTIDVILIFCGAVRDADGLELSD